MTDPPDPGAEERCRESLEVLRWPDGARCPRCSAGDAARITGRKQLRCRACDYRFSATVGTSFEGSHLPLWKWFRATELLTSSEELSTARQLQRALGVSYKTAWYLWHRIHSAIEEQPLARPTGTPSGDHPDPVTETLRRLIDGDPVVSIQRGRGRRAGRP